MKTSLASLLSMPLLLSHLYTLVLAIDCKQDIIVKDDNRRYKYDFSRLDSVHSVYSVDRSKPPSVSNTTWSINICGPLPIDKKIPKKDQCETGTTGRQQQLRTRVLSN
jgi:autophagy-related protein 27